MNSSAWLAQVVSLWSPEFLRSLGTNPGGYFSFQSYGNVHTTFGVGFSMNSMRMRCTFLRSFLGSGSDFAGILGILKF